MCVCVCLHTIVQLKEKSAIALAFDLRFLGGVRVAVSGEFR